MEMKQINETTLKIMITMEDLEEHGMELKDFLIPQEKTEEFFYTVMDELDLPDNFKNSGMLSFRVTPRKDRVDVFVTKSDLKEDLDFNDLSDMEDYSGLSPEEFLKALEDNFMDKGDIEAHHKLEEHDKTLKEVDETMTEPAKEVAEETIREDYTHYVLAFSDFDQVVTFAQGLKNVSVEGSEFYKLGDVYYMTILLYLADEPDYYANNMYARFLEYANVADRTRPYLQEHATILMEEDALPVLQATKWSEDMPWTINYIFVLIGTSLIAIVGTPLVRSLAFRVGAVDNPNARRINKKPMPSAGGLAIFLAFVLATLVFMPMIIQKDVWHISYFRYILPVAVGGAIVVLTGFIDDIFELKPLPKMLGIVIGAVGLLRIFDLIALRYLLAVP